MQRGVGEAYAESVFHCDRYLITDNLPSFFQIIKYS